MFRLMQFGMMCCALLLAVNVPAQENRFSGPPPRPRLWPGIQGIVERIERQLTRASQAEAGGDQLFAGDLSSESIDGPSNYSTTLSNGRLGVGISPWADLTLLRWPGLSYSDQLRYFTTQRPMFSRKDVAPVRMNKDAPSLDWRRYGHPIEQYPELGSRGAVQLADGSVVFIGDPSWTTSRGYEPLDSTVLVTRLQRPGLEVAVADWVDPDRDLLVRSFSLGSGVKQFFYHSTFAPWISSPGRYTQIDPEDAGFAAVYLPEDQVIMHFRPKDSKSTAELRGARDLTRAKKLDQLYPSGGVFIAWGLLEPNSAWQVGADRAGHKLAENAPLGGHAAIAKGSLPKNSMFIGPVDAALSRDLGGSASTVTVLIAVADSAEKAAAMVKAARAEGLSALQARATVAWQKSSARVLLPAKADPVSLRVGRRSVLNLIQGQDAKTGAIMASISRQPHYHFDWPRDGAFFDLTLDMAGFPELVTKHHEFYVKTQLQGQVAYSPAFIFNYRTGLYRPRGHWMSNMASDGSRGSMPAIMTPWEIDETGLTLWNFWRHERYLSGADKDAYIKMVRPALEEAADACVRYVNVKHGWMKEALEDDNFPASATLHGASSVLVGLAAAVDAGSRWGVDPKKVACWRKAAVALREGMLGRVKYDSVLKDAGYRGLQWTLWPAPLFTDFTVPDAKRMLDRLAEDTRVKADKETPGFAYLGENIFCLALAAREQPQYRPLLEKALKVLTQEVAYPGTDCFGEVNLWGDFAGTGQKVGQARTSIPHLWNGVTAYLSVMALYQPEAFDGLVPPIPK